MVDFLFDDRERKIVEIIKGFLQSLIIFRSLYDKKKDLTFAEVNGLIDDKGKSKLFNLKENCHSLFRNDNVQKCSEKEKLFDLAIGSIFHETMKLREDFYQLTKYGPRYEELNKKPEKTIHEKQLFNQFSKIIVRTKQRLVEDYEDTVILFEDTVNQMHDLLPEYSNNGLVVRFLLEHESLINDAYGENGLNKLLDSMFENGHLGALCVAARSYASGGYHEMAAEKLKKAIEINKVDKYVEFSSYYCMGVRDYYARKYNHALTHFQDANNSAKDLKNITDSVKMMDHFSSKIKQATRQE